ncbi:MAG: hypothetical protein ACKOQ4_05795 [Mycobacterium sp.]
MKWKVATASVVAAAIVSAPVASAAPADGSGIIGPNNVGQTISQIAGLAAGGANPAAILDALNSVRGLIDQLKPGKKNRGSGRGAILQQQTQANIGKTLRQRASDLGVTPDSVRDSVNSALRDLPKIPATP